MATTARRGFGGVANVLRIIGLAIVAVLVVHIALQLLPTDHGHPVVVRLGELATVFDLGLSNLFQVENAQLAIILNYGLPAVIWYAITAVVVRLVGRLG